MSASTTTLQPPRSQAGRAFSAQARAASLRSSSQSSNNRSSSSPHPSQLRQSSKDAILRNTHPVTQRQPEPGPAEQIPSDPMSKGIGFSSKTLRVQDFELIQTLGTGTFARVWLTRFKNTRSQQEKRKVFALKVLKKVDVIKLKQVEHVRNERNVLAAVSGHPFITQMLASFSDSHSLYMLLEYTPGGEIFSYLRKARRFPFHTVQFYAAEITLILAYLHDVQHVAYRDLKPENILLDAEGHLKLVDFGFAKYLPPDTTPPASTPNPEDPMNNTNSSSSTTNSSSEKLPDTLKVPGTTTQTYTLCGTPEYLAPEVIRNTGHGTPVDWWALGILVYEMLIGQPPFWDPNPMKIYEQIIRGHIRFPVTSSHQQFQQQSQPVQDPGGASSQSQFRTRSSLSIPRSARDFILALCKTDPTERLGYVAGGSKRVMQHYFFDGLNWDDVYYRRNKGPIIPRVEYEGDAGNFDEYPDPVGADGESEYGRGGYTDEMRETWEAAFEDF